MGMAGKRQALEMVPLVVVVVVVVADKTFCMVVAVVIVRGMMIHIWMILLLPGLLSKAMSNRAQNLHLSGVLLPY